MSDELQQAAQVAINAMADFFEARSRAGLDRSGVIWLENTNGRVLIFTRGEYRDCIMAAVRDVDDAGEPVTYFQTEPPSDP